MHHHELECCVKWFGCYFQGQGHSKGSYDQNMTVSTVSSELLILLLQNLVWWYIIISLSVSWRNWIAVFKVKVTAKLQNVNDCLSRCLLNCQTLYYQTCYSYASLWARLSYKKCWFAVFKVKVTMKDHDTKDDFVMYLLNCWSFCNKTWFDSTLS